MSRYLLTKLTLADLEEILGYIADDRPSAAERVGARFVSAFEALAENPDMGHAVERPVALDILASPALKKLKRTQATEREEDLRELPARFVNLAFSAYVSGKISTGKLAELLETTVGMLPEKLAAYGLDPEPDVYQATVLPS